MNSIIEKIRKNLNWKVILLSLLLLVVPVRAEANIISSALGFDSFASMIASGARVIIWVIGWIGGILFQITSQIVQFFFELNMKITKGGARDLIETGWNVARDIANLGFVMAIIIIALAITVQWQEYGSKKLVMKLIGAAIIVNFSLAIAFVFINFSHVITNFFLESSQGAGANLSENLANAFGVQELFIEDEISQEAPPAPQPSSGGGLSAFSASFLMSLGGIFFSAAFVFIAVLTMGALAFMLLIRYVWLTILLILAPIAWLFWVIPKMGHIFSDWWSKFLKWTFFAPAVSFFLYLSLLSTKKLGEEASPDQIAKGLSGTLKQVIQQGTDMFVLVGLMLGGIVVANSLSIKGAQGAMNIAKGAGNKVKGWSKGAATGIKQRAITAGSSSDEEGRSYAERAASWVATKPVVGRAFRGTAESIGKAKSNLKDETENRQEDLENITNEDLKSRANKLSGGNVSNPVEASAIASEMAKRNMIGDLDDEGLDNLVDAVQKTGTSKSILKSKPSLAGEFGKEIGEVVQGLSSSDATDIASEELENSEVVLSLETGHLGKIGSDEPKKAKKVTEKIQELKSKEGDLEPEEKEKLGRILDYLKGNSNYPSVKESEEGGGIKIVRSREE